MSLYVAAALLVVKELRMARLTQKQETFCLKYFELGNIGEAALTAGYSPKTAPYIGSENLKKPQIKNLIDNRETKKSVLRIATREQRQNFWTKMMKKAEKDSDKLKASELLGRSEADFIDRHEVGATETVEGILKKLTGD